MQFKSIPTQPHVNELGFEMISNEMWSYLFAQAIDERPKIDNIQAATIKAAFSSFEGYQFPPELTPKPEYSVQLPTFKGNLEDHINKLAETKWGPVKRMLLNFLDLGIPKFPGEVIRKQSGRTRYEPLDVPETNLFEFDFFSDETNEQAGWDIKSVQSVLEDVMVFDVETFVKSGNGPVMAVAVTNKAWYFWLHPAVATTSVHYSHTLIQLGNGKVILNHNPKFDSARVQETYDLSLGNKRNIWLDTLSMHMSVCGMSSKQRVPYKAYQNGSVTHSSKWAKVTSPNSLVQVYNLHVKPLRQLTADDKSTRNIFVVASDVSQFRDNLDELIYYTLMDGAYTYELGQALVPKYFKSQPHILTFGGSCILSRSFLPVIADWDNHLLGIEKVYMKAKKELKKAITHIAEVWASYYANGKLTDAKVQADPRMSQLDWTRAKTGVNKGYPLWYRKVKAKGISTKSRLAPLLLKMTWLGQPLCYHSKHGWIYPSPPDSPSQLTLPLGLPGPSTLFKPGPYSKVPHKKGDHKNCGSPLSKDYIDSIERGLLGSNNEHAMEYLKQAKSIAYWTSMRSRAIGYKALPCKYPDGSMGTMVEPMLLSAGTASRRCVESLWLTVSSAKPKIIGSELKGLVRPINWDKELPDNAPGHYLMVGADFDA